MTSITIGNDIERYFKAVSAFDRYNENVKPSVYFLGLSGEVGELCDVLSESNFPFDTTIGQKITSELGDIFWYWIALANKLGIDYKAIWNKTTRKYIPSKVVTLKLVASVGRLSEHLKKSIRDDGGKITDKRLVNITEKMEETLSNLFSFCYIAGDNPYDILQKNYDKLSARYQAGTLQGEGDGVSGTERKSNI